MENSCFPHHINHTLLTYCTFKNVLHIQRTTQSSIIECIGEATYKHDHQKYQYIWYKRRENCNIWGNQIISHNIISFLAAVSKLHTHNSHITWRSKGQTLIYSNANQQSQCQNKYPTRHRRQECYFNGGRQCWMLWLYWPKLSDS